MIGGSTVTRVKRLAKHTLARLGKEIPATAELVRKIANAMAGGERSPSVLLGSEMDGEKLRRYVTGAPHPQNAVDIFKGEWSSRLPPELGVHAGEFLLFEDPRLRWALTVLGGIHDRTVLELGPLEGGHAYILETAGARQITAIEANVRAYLKCLIVKELVRLQHARFLCGDFVKFLETNNQRFDIVLACGVLYHMTEPLRFLELVGRATDRVVIFTHYYDEALIRGNPRTAPNFGGGVEARVSGFRCLLYPQRYGADALASLGFCGGTELVSAWMTRQDILAALRHLGFMRIETSHEEPAHPNGPAFALVAQR